MAILSLHDVNKNFGETSIIRGVSLDIQAGEKHAIIGPNGAGKTTSFYMITGLVLSDGGSVHLDAQDLTRYPMHMRARLGVGYLPQEPSVFRHLTVEENILGILEVQDDLEPAERKKRLEELLEDLHVGHLRRNRGDGLSGGERRRVEIARALASEPRFMLLDEPFAGVDPISIIDIKRIISYLSERNIGILITDHNVRETLDICDRAYIVSEGHIIAEGRPEVILRDERVREVYLGHDFKL